MQTVEEKPSNENPSDEIDEPKSTPLANGHVTNPSSSAAEVSNGESDSSLKNDSDVPPDPAAGILRSFSLSEEKLCHIPFVKSSTNRVKLYILCDQRTWDDRGTGHVTCIQYPDDPQSWYLIVRLEASESNVLESPIHNDTVYQRQQGTLIVWSESDTCDLALSFQEKSGCSTIWDKICQIQGRDPDMEEEDVDDQQSDSSNSNASSGIVTSIALPVCSLTTIQEIDQIILNNMGTPSAREKMANTLQQQNYLPKLIEVFKTSEDIDHPNLHFFYSIAKNMFLLNSNLMLDELLSENHFKDIVGMLEHDPTSTEPKKHREFLFEKSRFKEVLPIKTDDLKNKIKQTYMVQYIQDVCLPAPSLFEENLLTCLSSRLFFARAEIVNQLIGDKELMRQLFDELKSTDTSPIRRRDLSQFLREFCSFVHALQSSTAGGREQFFKTILTNDMLTAINLCITNGLPATRNSAIEIISMIVDYNPVFMRDFLKRQASSVDTTEEVLLNKIVSLIMEDMDPELSMANNISTMIKNLLDSDNVVTLTSMGRTSPRSMIEKQTPNKHDKQDFFAMFYGRIIETLVKPLFDNISEGKLIQDDYFKASQMGLILELTSFCVENHVQNMKAFVIQQDLLSTICVYLNSQHHFMALSALRVIRRVVQQKDEQYNRYIIDKKIIDPIVECFVANGERYNLLNSAVLEFFDFIRHDSINSLLAYVIKNHYDSTLKNVDYTQLFTQMKARQNARENSTIHSNEDFPSYHEEHRRPTFNAQWSRELASESDELFFNDSDEEAESLFTDSDNLSDQKSKPQRKIAMEPIYPSVAKRKLNSDEDGVASIFGGNERPGISQMKKITIKMSDRLDTASPPPAKCPPSPLKEEDKVTESTEISPIQFGPSQPVVSPLATSSFTVSKTSTSPPTEPESKRPKYGTPIPDNKSLMLKRKLVEYADSDSDEEQ